MIFGLLMALAGLVLIIFGQRMFWVRQFARMRGQVIQGTIVQWKKIRTRGGPRSSSASGVMYFPEVLFVDPEGTERTIQLSYQYTPQFIDQNPTGSSLPVLFDPLHPDRSLDTTWTMAYFLPVLMNFCGGLVALLGLGIFFGS